MNYIEEAIKTKSDQFHGDNVNRTEFFELLQVCIYNLARLDKVKKGFFYDKPIDDFALTKVRGSHNDCSMLPFEWANSQTGEKIRPHTAIDIIHCILGKATEAGELLELLKATLTGTPFDPTNFHEEIFDGQWYDAIGCKAVGMTFEEGQARNIAKLKKRFPDKFKADDANNRDLIEERKALEAIGSPVLEEAVKVHPMHAAFLQKYEEEQKQFWEKTVPFSTPNPNTIAVESKESNYEDRNAD